MRDPWASLRIYAATLLDSPPLDRRKLGRYQCGQCLETKGKDSFYIGSHGGPMTRCKTCYIARVKAYQERRRGRPAGKVGRPRLTRTGGR